MPRVRWAQRCTAHRSDGTPCTNWAIRGGRVCTAHGGSLWRTRQAAAVRLSELVMRRAHAAARAKWERQVVAFQVQRVLTTAKLMEIAPDEVTEWHMFECRLIHGEPAGSWEAPQLRDVPIDGRYKTFFRSGSAMPRPRKVRSGQQ